MVAGILIITFSVVLLVYWFRYSCLLILRGEREGYHAEHATVDSRFGFGEVQRRVASEILLDPLHAALDRDYRVLLYLIEHGAGLELAALEDRLLMIDYRLMQLAYRMTRIAAPEQARRALKEMAGVIEILAGRLGRQAGVQNEI